MNCIAEVITTDIQTWSIDRLHAEQKKDIHCRNLVAQSHCKNKDAMILLNK